MVVIHELAKYQNSNEYIIPHVSTSRDVIRLLDTCLDFLYWVKKWQKLKKPFHVPHWLKHLSHVKKLFRVSDQLRSLQKTFVLYQFYG